MPPEVAGGLFTVGGIVAGGVTHGTLTPLHGVALAGGVVAGGVTHGTLTPLHGVALAGGILTDGTLLIVGVHRFAHKARVSVPKNPVGATPSSSPIAFWSASTLSPYIPGASVL